jgi:hypothetical protein
MPSYAYFKNFSRENVPLNITQNCDFCVLENIRRANFHDDTY